MSLLLKFSTATLAIISLYCFYYGVRHNDKHKELKYLFIYPLASLIQVISLYVVTEIEFFSAYAKSEVIFSIHLFILIEISIIYIFFYKIDILNNQIKRGLLVIYILYMSLYFLRMIFSNELLIHAKYTYYIQAIIILTPCFIYIYQLFLQPPTLNLLEEPTFWLIAGLIVYNTLTLPLYFMLGYFTNNPMSDLIDFININGYSLIFFFLLKGYRCNPKIII